MRIVKLSPITGIQTSNVTGSAHAEYVAGTTYAAEAKVKVSFESNGTTPRFPVIEYESLAGSNVGNYPPSSPDKWSEIGAENRCKMFDGFTNTQTIHNADMEVSIDASGADTVGLFNLYGTRVHLSLVHDSEVKKTEEFDLRTFLPESGWYAWLYGSYEYGINQIIWNMPRYAADAVLEITIDARSSVAGCGLVVIGRQIPLGLTQYGPRFGIDDYSIKATDALGRTYLNQGAFAKRADIEMWMTKEQIDFVHRQLTKVRGEPAIFDLNNPDSGYQALAIYGFCQNFEITIPGYNDQRCNMEIRGLI
jgi:hypothetical protein